MKNPNLKHTAPHFALENLQLTYGKVRDENKKEHKLHEKYQQFFMPKSTAEYVDYNQDYYMVGALARINQSKNLIPKQFQSKFPSKNPFDNNLAQAIEIQYFIEKAIELLSNLKIKKEKLKTKKSSASLKTSLSFVEAPRGILFHKYEFDKNGKVEKADIVTPTSQNLKQLEEDIKTLLEKIIHKKNNEIRLEVEKLIRAYDPCISCATHFLTLDIEKI